MAKIEKRSTRKQIAPSHGGFWDPVASFREEMDRTFGRMFGAPILGRTLAGWEPFAAGGHDGGGMLMPQIDVSETDKAYEIAAELPGVEEKDVTLTIEGDRLTLKGEKKSEREEKDKNYYTSERSYGSFVRSFQLPDDIDPDKAQAKFAKGVLTVTLPKSAESGRKQRRITIEGD